MDVEQIITFLKLPPKVVVRKRITKKIVMENDSLTTGEKNIIKKFVDMMYWVAAIKNKNTNIPVVQSEDEVFDEVHLIASEINNKDKCEKVAQVMQKIIPYHLLLIITNDNTISFNVALKRVNQNELDKRVITDFLLTKWRNLKDNQSLLRKFFSCLSLENLSHENIKILYHDIIQCLQSLEISRVTENFDKNDKAELNKSYECIQRIDGIDNEIDALKNLICKETQYNNKVEINMNIKHLEETKSQLISELKRINV